MHQLADELDRKGLRSRSNTRQPLSLNGLSKMLHNPAYIGKVPYQGVQHDGSHQPLIDDDTFHTVQPILASRAARGTKERNHPHHLKGLLYRLPRTVHTHRPHRSRSRPHLPTRPTPRRPRRPPRNRTTQRDRHPPAPHRRRTRPTHRTARRTRRRTPQTTRRLLRQRHPTRPPQSRTGPHHPRNPPHPTTTRQRQRRPRQLAPTLTLAANFAANCHTANRAASETAKKQLNHAMFARITLRNGHIDQWEFQPPFDELFDTTRLNTEVWWR